MGTIRKKFDKRGFEITELKSSNIKTKGNWFDFELAVLQINLPLWSKVLGQYQFPPSPESMLEYQLYTVRDDHQLTPTLIRGEGGIIGTVKQ